MGLPQRIRSIAKIPLTALLKMNFLRRRIIFELTQHYFDELRIVVPIGFNLNCPIAFREAWSSFSEIFFNLEYGPAFDVIPLPNRWLDLGCHCGFFSLFIVWLRQKNKLTERFDALLMDGDIRVQKAVEQLITLNNWQDQMSFQLGLISAQAGQQEFLQRSHMASSLASTNLLAGPIKLVETINAQQIMALLPPPYDVVKVDIEGAEYDFLSSYESILKETKFLIIEWHSWHSGGGGAKQIMEMAHNSGFDYISEIGHTQSTILSGVPIQWGVSLFKKTAPV